LTKPKHPKDTPKHKFDLLKKVMVANRGEIAIRVFRACKELGIPTLAVFSEADKGALFTKYADEAYLLGPAPAKLSYLNMDKLIEIAKEHGVEGIHPGYGFLAENAKFSDMCAKNGMEFIGPTPFSIGAMGDKIEAKKSMIKAGVPVVPGVQEAIKDPKDAKDIAIQIGFPVMVKAAAGGGGIGISIVKDAAEIDKVIESTQRVAQNAFGDGRLFIEKFIENPRHIEFQIIADKFGNYVHCNERECSVQRRNQKLIEETPSCIMTPELRKEMGDAAKLAAKTIKYSNAGTCEFMFSKGKYYFLEMNTRLQVEHPITEMITGLDLAREQLIIASGYELSFTQDDVKVSGHSMECRINAEDPINDFKPAPGRITKYAEPGGPGVRVDSGVFQGWSIPQNYDSLIAKLITWGPTRVENIQRMKRALWEFDIRGPRTNIAFHQVVLRWDDFLKGDYDTKIISRHEYKDDIKKYLQQLAAEMAKKPAEPACGGGGAMAAAVAAAAVSTYIASAGEQQQGQK